MSVASSSPGDLPSKYQKLAVEYSKIRAQLPILKKAVLDEQSRNAELSDELKSKDLSVRKTQQEIESLVFRNQQLMRRVEILQDKLDEQNSSRKQKSSKNGTVKHDDSVLSDELRRKVEENASLHSQLFDLEQSGLKNVQNLQGRMRILDSENSLLAQQLTDAKEKSKLILEEFKAENDTLNQRNAQLIDELDEAKSELTFERRRDTLCAPFDATSDTEDETEKVASILTLLECNAVDSVTHLANFHSYLEQRAGFYPRDRTMETLSDTCKQLIEISKKQSIFIKPLSMAIKSFCESKFMTCDFGDLSGDLRSYFHFITELVPVLSKSIEDECQVSWCSNGLIECNRNFVGTFHHFVDCLNSLCKSLDEICGATEYSAMYRQFSTDLQSVSQSVNSLKNAFSAKIMSEHLLPTATKRLKTTNECLMASINAFSTSFSKLQMCFMANVKTCANFHRFVSNRAASRMSTSTAHGSLVTVGLPEKSLATGPDFTPSDPGVLENVNSGSSGVIETLEAEIGSKNQHIVSLEKEKEHWILECQFLRVKLDAAASSGRASRKGSTVKLETEPADTTELDAAGAVVSALPLDLSCTGDVTKWMEAHYSTRIAELITQNQQTESRSNYFISECDNLVKNLKSLHMLKSKVERDCCNSQSEIFELKEEIETVRHGYENQLKTLTEHLASLNVTLTKQSDEILHLKQPKKGLKSKFR